MEYQQREQLIYRIINGFIYFKLDNSAIKIYCPSAQLLYEADLFKNEIREDIKYGDWLTHGQVERIVFHLGQVPLDYKERLEKGKTQLDDLKVQLYMERFNMKREKSLKRQLRDLEYKLEGYNTPFDYFKTFTLDGYSDLCKSDYVVVNSVIDDNNEKPLSADCSYNIFSSLISFINENEITVGQFRELARSEPWRSYWACNKTNIFDKGIQEWTEHQRYLVMFSKMYDNVYESHECPSDSVIEDDDKLDGWFIYQRREIQRQRAQQGINDKMKRHSKHDEHDEHFIITRTPEERKRVEQLNDASAINMKQQRFNTIKQKGIVKEAEMPDVKRQLSMDAHNKFREHVKGKK